MATSFAQYVSLMDAAVAKLRADAPDIAVGFASDCLALVQERIQNKGTSASGSALKRYTAAYEKFKRNPGAYKRGKDLGLASSRYTGKTDYTLTGRMWADIRPLRVEGDGKNIRVIIGAQKTENRNKLESLAKRDGVNPLLPAEDEQEIALGNIKERVLSYFDFMK